MRLESLMVFQLFKCYVLILLLWNSLSHGLSIFQEGKSSDKDTLKLEAQAEKSKVCQTCQYTRLRITEVVQC